MTLLQSRLLYVQLAASLAAAGVIYTWYDKYAPFFERHPVLGPALLVAIPLYILCFFVGPKMWQRWRQAQRDAIALAPDPAPGQTRHFRLDPYVTASPQDFRREDDAHNDVLKWISETSRPVLFLSGMSGTGKSSVLEGFVLPMLRDAGWKVEQVRTVGDPLSQLETILDAPRRKGTRLLVVFDQFEEFVILEDRASDEARRRFVARLQEICRAPPAGVCLLLSFRLDYMRDVIALQIDDLMSGRAFMEISAFRRGAARRFLEAAPAAPTTALVDRMLSGAEALDDVPKLFRPVTLNMLGLALEEYDREMLGRPERLVQTYIETAMSQPEIKEIAPRVIEKMITEANTKRPRAVAEVAAEACLSTQDVLACLVLFERKGLIRRLGGLWEISHDFVARQFALALGRLRPNQRHKLAAVMLAGAFVFLLSAATIGMPLIVREQAFASLRSLHFSVAEGQDGELSATARGATDATLASALPHLAFIGINALDLSGSTVASLPPLDSLTGLTSLDLSNLGVTSPPALDKLTALKTLRLRGWKTDLPSLDNLTALRTLDLSFSKVNSLPSLDKLRALTTLDLSYSEVTSLPSLDKLTALRTLNLAASRVTSLPSLDNLTELTTLNLGQMFYLDLTSLPSLDNLGALTTLELRGLALTSLPSLDKLTALTTLNLDATPVTSLPSLDRLPNLTELDVSHTRLLRELPPLDKLTKLKRLVMRGRAELLDGPDLQQLRSRGVVVVTDGDM